MPHITVGISVLELLGVTVVVFWIREAQCLICRWQTPGVSGEVQRSVCHVPWEQSQALPALWGWDFPFASVQVKTDMLMFIEENF